MAKLQRAATRRPSRTRRPRTRRRRGDEGEGVPLWLVIAVALGLLAGSTAGSAVDADLMAPPGPVLLAGDSLFFQSTDELERVLRSDGWAVRTVAYPGAGIAGGGYVENLRWPSRLGDEVSALQPSVAVVELGTNGCGEGCDSIPDAIDDVIDSLEGVDTVLWLTVRTEPSRPSSARAINEHLRDAADTIVGLDLLAYHEWLHGRSELVRSDGVHLTSQGERVMANRVRDALRQRAGIES